MKVNFGALKFGFTGTQDGMTEEQLENVEKLLKLFPHLREVHHGDCIGADAEFHKICEKLNIEDIVIHPPINESKRAFCKGIIREQKEYIKRNHDIVDESDIIIGTPKMMHEELRSGTWATIRYAAKKWGFAFVVWPNGEVEKWTK